MYRSAILIWAISAIACYSQFETVINIPPDTLPAEIDANTQINVFDGAVLEQMPTNENVEYNIYGGMITAELLHPVNVFGGISPIQSIPVAASGTVIHDGQFSDGFFISRDASVTINGGLFGTGFEFGGSTRCCADGALTINGGEFGPDFDARYPMTVEINGGHFQGDERIRTDFESITTINGGYFESIEYNGLIEIRGGEFERVYPSPSLPESGAVISGGIFHNIVRYTRNSNISLYGHDFRIAGEEVMATTYVSEMGEILTGVLSDGMPIILVLPSGEITLNRLNQDAIEPLEFLTSVDGVVHPQSTQRLTVDSRLLDTLVLPSWGSFVDIAANGSIEKGVDMAGVTMTVKGELGGDFGLYYSDVTVLDNGRIGTNLSANGGLLRLVDGTIGEGLSVADGEFIVEGGIVDFGPTMTNSKFSVAGGAFVGQATVIDSDVAIEGGLFGDDLAFENSRGRISGGSFGSTFIQGGEMEIAGGLFEGKLSVAGGTTVTIAGESFALDGVPIEFGDSNEVIIADRNVVLTGQFENSEPIEFDLYSINRSNRDFFSNDATVILQRIDSTLLGDLNRDGLVDVQDLDMLAIGLRMNPEKAMWDVDQDGRPTDADRLFLIHDVLGTPLGDSNLDGRFDSSDFVQVFTAGLFETGDPAGWADGDWNGDGLFSTADLVVAFTAGGFSADVKVVPEPAGWVWTWLLLSVISIRRQLRTVHEKNS